MAAGSALNKAGSPPPESVRAELLTIRRSTVFGSAPRLQKLLGYLVEESLARNPCCRRQPEARVNGGHVAFNASLAGQPYSAIYVAGLPCAANFTSKVSITPGTLTQNPTTKIYSQTATVANHGSSAVAGPLSLVRAKLPSGVALSDRSGVAVCFVPGRQYINFPLRSYNALLSGKSTEVVLEFNDPSNTAISFTSVVAGPGAR